MKKLIEMRDKAAYTIAHPMLRDMISRGTAEKMCRDAYDQAVKDLMPKIQNLIECIEAMAGGDELNWTLEQERIGNRAVAAINLRLWRKFVGEE